MRRGRERRDRQWPGKRRKLVVIVIGFALVAAAAARVARALTASDGRRSKAWRCISIDALLVRWEEGCRWPAAFPCLVNTYTNSIAIYN